ncbi:MAG: cation:proton antiporter, partial [Armatimonadetes bacterium]|nr:cation:proton antiporter [Armatimonadota bacterium]
MPQIADLFLQLFIIFAAAQVGAEVAARLKLPSVVGEIGAGMLVGPSVLGWIPIKDGHAPVPFEMLAEIGVVFLMFSVGLETRLGELRRIGRLATVVALFGVIVPFGFGIAWASTQTPEVAKQAFISTAFVATSVAITARVLADLNALGRREAKVILAAAVLDDILAMLLLGAVAAFQPPATQTGSFALRLAILALEALAFVVALT